jgi:hypothetical protein
MGPACQFIWTWARPIGHGCWLAYDLSDVLQVTRLVSLLWMSGRWHPRSPMRQLDIRDHGEIPFGGDMGRWVLYTSGNFLDARFWEKNSPVCYLTQSLQSSHEERPVVFVCFFPFVFEAGFQAGLELTMWPTGLEPVILASVSWVLGLQNWNYTSFCPCFVEEKNQVSGKMKKLAWVTGTQLVSKLKLHPQFLSKLGGMDRTQYL